MTSEQRQMYMYIWEGRRRLHPQSELQESLYIDDSQLVLTPVYIAGNVTGIDANV